MKFYGLKAEDLEDFFEVINSCEGNVYFECPDMRLNLKSNLCKYVSLAKLCVAGHDDVKEIEIYAESKEDVDRLFKYMCGGGV